MEDCVRNTGSASTRVKRRPLPSPSSSGAVTPDKIQMRPHPGRAKHGPRDISVPARANSMPPEMMPHAYDQQHAQTMYAAPTPSTAQAYASSPTSAMQRTTESEFISGYDVYDDLGSRGNSPYSQQRDVDLLPQLPPSSRQRTALARQPRYDSGRDADMPPHGLPEHMVLQHSHSAPMVPRLSTHAQVGHETQLRVDYPEPIPDLEYQHQQLVMRPRQSHGSTSWPSHDEMRSYDVENDLGYDNHRPPPPPMHSNSAPALPHYNTTAERSTEPLYNHSRSNERHNAVPSVPNSSPLQGLERRHVVSPQRTPVHARGMSVDSDPSNRRNYGSPPPGVAQGQSPSPHHHHPSSSRPASHPNSLAGNHTTPSPRPHPLSYEVPRSRSPLPQRPVEHRRPSPHSNDASPYQQAHNVYTRPVQGGQQAPSLQTNLHTSNHNSAPRSHSTYSIQHPIRAFESADNSPLSTSQRIYRPPSSAMYPASPASASPLSKPTENGVPFSPDSFDVHNPNARSSVLPAGTSPHSPYQIPSGSGIVPQATSDGPIVGWHGQQIDPSDHLPVDSWAPEPEKKTPTRTYGLGRDRDFGPRAPGSGDLSCAKDTKISVRLKPKQAETPPPQAQPDTGSFIKNKLRKKSATSPRPIEPLAEHHNYNPTSIPDPYAQQQFSHNGGFGHGDYPSPQPIYSTSPTKYAPPHPEDTLSREISSIGIGGGRNGRVGHVPSPTAYVPVRSHRDRHNFY